MLTGVSSGSFSFATTGPRASLAADQASFAKALNIAERAADLHAQQRTPQEADARAAARTAAEDFVSIAFIQPVLKQLRETSQAAAPFAPSSAEKSFRGMLDDVLSRNLTRASNFPLVERVTQRLLRQGDSSAKG